MGEKISHDDDIVHMVKLSVSGHPREVVALAKRIARRKRRDDPDRADTMLAQIVAAAEPLNEGGRGLRRSTQRKLPDSLPPALAQVEVDTELTIVLPDSLREQLDQVLLEWRNRDVLQADGLTATRTLVFEGPPGVGKTLSAQWLARELERPLYVLDLATVVGSRLGDTGARLQGALAFARQNACVLLLDEFDAIASRRSAEGDVGEMRRVVTVLLQEIDRWQGLSPLIAATNHPELIDPAIWRRFEERFEFPLSDMCRASAAVRAALGEHCVDERYITFLGALYSERPYSDIAMLASRARKRALLKGISLPSAIDDLVAAPTRELGKASRQHIARSMLEIGFSQRKVREVTGFARDTLRKLTPKETSSHG